MVVFLFFSVLNTSYFISYLLMSLLLDQHSFSMGSTQDVNAIRLTIPRAFVSNFDHGVAAA